MQQEQINTNSVDYLVEHPEQITEKRESKSNLKTSKVLYSD